MPKRNWSERRRQHFEHTLCAGFGGVQFFILPVGGSINSISFFFFAQAHGDFLLCYFLCACVMSTERLRADGRGKEERGAVQPLGGFQPAQEGTPRTVAIRSFQHLHHPGSLGQFNSVNQVNLILVNVTSLAVDHRRFRTQQCRKGTCIY